MPTYPLINKKTGEKKELSMTMKEYDEWREANPDWDKDWSAGIGGTMYGKPKQTDGFKEVMQKISSRTSEIESFPIHIMPRPKKSLANIPTKVMRRKTPINIDHLSVIEPLTDNQKKVFDAYKEGKNLVLHGAAGTGKTFISLYLAMQDVLDPSTPYDKVYMVRSLVPTREIGFLPGDHEDKSNLYQIPYKNMVKYMFKMPDDSSFEMLYDNLRAQQTVSFWSTSFIRGVTLDKCVIIVDEFSNLNFHELDSIITRVGEDAKIIFSGDYTQSDLTKTNERTGVLDFMKILQTMPSFDCTEFGIEDIVRSGMVREYLVSKINLGFQT